MGKILASIGTGLATMTGVLIHAAGGIGAIIAGTAATISLATVGWAVLAGLAVGAITYFVWNAFDNQKEQNKSDLQDSTVAQNFQNAQNSHNQNANPTTNPIDTAQKDEAAREQVGYKDNTSYKPNQTTAILDKTNLPTVQMQQPTVEEMNYVVENAQIQAAEDNKAKYEEILAQLRGNESTKPNMDLLQQENVIENPFNQTVVDKEVLEDVEKKSNENIERLKDELQFDKSNFDGIEGYKFIIDGVPVTLYVKSNIELMSEDDEFDIFDHFDINTQIDTNNKGQEFATSKAYDEDGNPLDKVIHSSQEAYLEYGLNGNFGYAKLTSQGNQDNYMVEGYGENIVAANVKSYSTYFSGNYELKENEKELEVVLGTNSDILSQKEYSFRDKADITFIEGESESLPNAFKAAIVWASEVMREVNISSYILTLGEAEIVLGTNEESNEEILTWEEDGITYEYNSNTTITNATNGATYTIKDILENNMMTMKELVENGYEPLSINGEEYVDEETLKDAITSTKPSFTIKITEPEEIENYKMEVIYRDEENQKTYYFATECSHRYTIVTDEKEYSLQEALEIYTIEELMDKGLDCKFINMLL